MSSARVIRILLLCLSIIISSFNFGFSSLVTGTLVETSKELVPVEKLKVGQKVLSYNLEAPNPKDAIIEVAITKIDKHSTDSVFTLYTDENRWVEVSPQQFFFTLKSKSNDLIADFVQAQYLKVENMLIDVDLNCVPIVDIHKLELSGSYPKQYIETIGSNKHNRIKSVEKRFITIDVYAIEVEKPHTFLISDKTYFEKNETPRLLLTHNGIPIIGAGLSLAFGSTPASISFTEATLTAGGIGAEFGPAGVAIGFLTGLGYWGFQLYKNKNNKQSPFYLERADKNRGAGSKEEEKVPDAQAPGKPTKEDGYEPPKRWDGKKVRHPKTGQHGWPDDKGKVWVPTGPGALAHGGPHWDVIDKSGDHINVMPGGKIRGQK